MEFNIGDEVIHNKWPDKYYGRVVGFKDKDVRVEFFATDKHTTHEKGYSFGVGRYYASDLSLVVTLTPQEKVLRKIKLLEQKFEERQKQKAKEKEDANKVDASYTIASVQREQYQRPSIGEWFVSTETSPPRVAIHPTYL